MYPVQEVKEDDGEWSPEQKAQVEEKLALLGRCCQFSRADVRVPTSWEYHGVPTKFIWIRHEDGKIQ